MLNFDHPIQPMTDLERWARDIVGRHYDSEHGIPHERFGAKRALNVTALPSAYEKAGHVALSLRGTPTRGLIILTLASTPTAIDCLSGKAVRARDIALLCEFIRSLTDGTLLHIPRNFEWTSRDDIRLP